LAEILALRAALPAQALERPIRLLETPVEAPQVLRERPDAPLEPLHLIAHGIAPPACGIELRLQGLDACADFAKLLLLLVGGRRRRGREREEQQRAEAKRKAP